MNDVITKQGCEPREVWTKDYTKTLWFNLHGNTKPLTLKLKQDAIFKFLKDCNHILDVGCGWIHYKTDKNNVGLDMTPSMLKIAKKLHPEILLLRGNAFKLPFKDNQFEGLRSSGLLRHVKEWKPALSEMLRVANKKLAFSHLTGKLPFQHRCGEFPQWCVPKKQILKALPTKHVKIIHIKSWFLFNSLLFLVDLRKK